MGIIPGVLHSAGDRGSEGHNMGHIVTRFTERFGCKHPFACAGMACGHPLAGNGKPAPAADPNCPNVLRFQRALLPGKPSLIPRHIPRLRWWLPFAIHDRLRWSRPPPPQRLPISGRENSIRTTGLSIAADVRPRHPHPHYSTQAVRKRLVPRCRAAGERQCSDGMATAQFNPGISSRPTRNSIVELSKSSHARAITDPWAGLFCKI